MSEVTLQLSAGKFPAGAGSRDGQWSSRSGPLGRRLPHRWIDPALDRVTFAVDGRVEARRGGRLLREPSGSTSPPTRHLRPTAPDRWDPDQPPGRATSCRPIRGRANGSGGTNARGSTASNHGPRPGLCDRAGTGTLPRTRQRMRQATAYGWVNRVIRWALTTTSASPAGMSRHSTCSTLLTRSNPGSVPMLPWRS